MVLWVLESYVPLSSKIWFKTQKSLVFPGKKKHISDNAYKYFDFSIVGGNIYSSRIVISQPLPGRKGRCVNQ